MEDYIKQRETIQVKIVDRKFKDLKIRRSLPEIDWEAEMKLPCAVHGHILMAPPHCEEGFFACYICDKIWKL